MPGVRTRLKRERALTIAGLPAFWRPGPRGAALVFHGTLSRSFDTRERLVAETLASLGFGTLRVLFRPRDWVRPPCRTEVRRRLPAARAALRWVRAQAPGARIVLAGTSMGAMLAARLAAGASDVLLFSPPFRSARTGDSWKRWAPWLADFPGRCLLVVGGRDDDWAPLDLVRRVVRGWSVAPELVVVPGARHEVDVEEIRRLLLRWGKEA